MTGEPFENGIKTEVIDLNDPSKHCSSTDFPLELMDSYGGLLLPDIPIICGGDKGSEVGSKQCYILRNREFIPQTEMEEVNQGMGFGSVVMKNELM